MCVVVGIDRGDGDGWGDGGGWSDGWGDGWSDSDGDGVGKYYCLSLLGSLFGRKTNDD